ncbi:hypothetical protein LSH36_697g03115 [Paralvinella palmiformis]|uniref:Uncharacterized protein n=1 Tax=Paralvinella palmiformis TaxID=53620 RepID=A0AAD9MTT5_9ANNE|nr:hypothetical protein LSH36_697g03115 [Paralvinella palmiformis]
MAIRIVYNSGSEMGTKQLNRFDESLLPRHQIISIKTKREEDMGCRIKDVIYLFCLLLLATGVWFSYSRPGQDLHEPWPWADETAEISRDLLHHPDYEGYFSDDPNYEDDGNRGFDEEDDGGQFANDLQASLASNVALKSVHGDLSEDKGSSALHQEESEYRVPYNEQLIDLTNPQVGEYYEPKERLPTGEMPTADERGALALLDAVHDSKAVPSSKVEEGRIVEEQGGQMPAAIGDGVNAGQPTNNAAVDILTNHADRARQLGIVPSELPHSDMSKVANEEAHLDAFEEKFKPRILLRSLDAKQERDLNKDVPKIPRIIHQSWETADVPVGFVTWIQSWLKKNPNWEYWFWTKQDVDELIEKNYPTFSNLLKSDSVSTEDRANVMRYFIIHAHGGLYAELDMECLNSMDSWVFSHGCFLAEETREHSYLVHNKLQGNVINALMACKAHHPFYEVIIHALPDYLVRFRGNPSHASGSFFLNDIYQAFKKHPLPPTLAEYGDVALIEPDYFIPRYDERHWRSIDEACNRNIVDMPFHVSWLCTLWIRKRMHENEPYKHSYADHHWIDIAEMGPGNINTVSVISVIQDVLARRQQPNVESRPEMLGNPLPGGNVPGTEQQQSQFPVIPQDITQNQIETAHPQPPIPQQLPIIPQEFPLNQDAPHSQLSGLQQPQLIPHQEQPQLPLMPQELQQQQIPVQIPQIQDNQYRLPAILKPQDQGQIFAANVNVPQRQPVENYPLPQYIGQKSDGQMPPTGVYSGSSQTNTGFINLPPENQTRTGDVSSNTGFVQPLESLASSENQNTQLGSLSSVQNPEAGVPEAFNVLNGYGMDIPTKSSASSGESSLSSVQNSEAGVPEAFNVLNGYGVDTPVKSSASSGESSLSSVQNSEAGVPEAFNVLNGYGRDTPTKSSASSGESSINSKYQPESTVQNKLYEVLKQGAIDANLPPSAPYEQRVQTSNNPPAYIPSKELINPIYH